MQGLAPITLKCNIQKKSGTKKEIMKDILISLAYVLLIVILVLTGILKSPVEYLRYLK